MFCQTSEDCVGKIQEFNLIVKNVGGFMRLLENHSLLDMCDSLRSTPHTPSFFFFFHLLKVISYMPVFLRV